MAGALSFAAFEKTSPRAGACACWILGAAGGRRLAGCRPRRRRENLVVVASDLSKHPLGCLCRAVPTDRHPHKGGSGQAALEARNEPRGNPGLLPWLV